MPPKFFPLLGFPRIELSYNTHENTQLIIIARHFIRLPMLIAKLYCISNRRSIKIKRIVQKYAVGKFGIPTNRSREVRTLLRCSSRRCDRTNHKLYTRLYENLQELVNYARGEVRATARSEIFTPRRAKWLCAAYEQLRGRAVIARQQRTSRTDKNNSKAACQSCSKYWTFFAQRVAMPIVPPICSASGNFTQYYTS